VLRRHHEVGRDEDAGANPAARQLDADGEAVLGVGAAALDLTFRHIRIVLGRSRASDRCRKSHRAEGTDHMK
jgi:hypothetical protein